MWRSCDDCFLSCVQWTVWKSLEKEHRYGNAYNKPYSTYVFLLQSHGYGLAHWDGECCLNDEQKLIHMARNLVDLSPDDTSLSEAFGDIGLHK